jgi:hypothetical protein
MRRLLRILLNAATVLSLVLCAATMAAWVRSYQARDVVYWSLANPELELKIVTHSGGLCAEALSALGDFSYVTPRALGGVNSPRAVTRRYSGERDILEPALPSGT